ncbi:Structural maintenance of chromosomes protein 5 [Apophysomyces ossiformis]|uniref:Structural maintenance of chromosomes protein 5 n=1 Tax=Apophysomyces ossiformis TaxID=679940 RepID=A0A8H7BNY9_9FUNG|nr:Structural maintenance of chromosomes protein 5 [Apophysomyces ossiformis]
MAKRCVDSEIEGLHASDSESAHESKRIRLESSDEDEEEDAPLPVGDDGYVEGSIVKITLRNFVTYDYCEFTPGPQLNMIIGPNGTGKSTIVCAIALGLGGAPSLLGRAKNIAEFVQTGEDEAMIKIELKKTSGRNVIIQRNIQKTNNSTSWKLNGRSTTQKEVLSVIARLNIQVDNLCQFLPQDKVAEFAQLSPAQLLERTQIAAGEKDLTNWQNKLIAWRGEQKSLASSHTSNQSHLKTLIERNQALEKDVQKMKEREEILKTVALLQAKLPLAKYSDAKKLHEEAKEDERQKLAVVRQLEIETEPVLSVVREHENAERSARETKDKFLLAVRKNDELLKKITDDIESSKNTSNAAKSEIKSLQKRKDNRKAEIASLEAKVAKMESQMSAEPPAADTSNIQAELDALRRKVNEVDEKLQSIGYEAENTRRQKTILARSKDQKDKELEEHNNAIKMRLIGMRRFNQDTVEAYQWLQKNRSMFKGRIHGPIVMTLNLKDSRYADAVESALGGEKGPHLRTFICETKEDYELFTRETVDKMGLRLTVGWPDTVQRSDIETPMTDEELKRRYGLDHFVVNLLTGPQIVLDYLCVQAKINLMPVSLNVVNEAKLADEGTFMRYIMNDSVYETKRYSYGTGGNQTTVRKIRRATLLTDSASREAKAKIMSSIEELNKQISEIDQRSENFRSQMNQLRHQKEEYNHKKEDLQTQKRDLSQRHVQWEKGMRALQHLKEDLVRKKNRPDDDDQEIKRFEETVISEAVRRGRLAVKQKELVTRYVESVLKRNVVSLEALQSAAKLDCVKLFSRKQMEKLNQAKIEHQEAARITEERKKKALGYYREAQKAGENIMEELAEEFKEIFEKWSRDDHIETQIELEDAINAAQARANALKSSAPGAMEQYKARVLEIKRLTSKIEEDTGKLDKLSKKIEEVKAQWEPRLVRIVSRISDKFSEALQRIGCAGEVGVSRHEDFDKWGIEIRVKFRDHEKLQLLTGQRQSGGERAVSTILYLMSLQDLAKAPFRVVDEINQGMDPRNERMIHEQIVRGASKPGTAQYFLITPKLLPDLYYNERMRVCCIYNGEWQPERMKPVSEYLRNARTAAVA